MRSIACLCVMVTGVVLGVTPARAGDYRCQMRLPSAEATLRRLEPDPDYDFSRDHVQLQQLGSETGLAVSHDRIVRGLTRTRFRYDFNVRMSYRRMGRGVCIWPTAVDGDLGYDTVIVYVDRKYPQGTCQFREVMKHELHHVRNHFEPLDDYLPRVRYALQRGVESSAFPMYVADVESGKRMVKAEVNRYAQGLVNAMTAETKMRDQQLDSLPSLRATQRACPRW